MNPRPPEAAPPEDAGTPWLPSRGAPASNPYINLPEEADAWRVERELRRLLKSRIQARLGDRALEGLAGLFD